MTRTKALKQFLEKTLGLQIDGYSPTEILTKAVSETSDGSISLGGESKTVTIVATPTDVGKEIIYSFTSEDEAITSNDTIPLIYLDCTEAPMLFSTPLYLFAKVTVNDELWAKYVDITSSHYLFIGPNGEITSDVPWEDGK